MQQGRHLLLIGMSMLLLGLGIGESLASGEMPKCKTQGFRECTELCYVKECGEVGIRCPTVTQKRMYRRLCYGRCKEQVRIGRLKCALEIERWRANRHRNLLILKHRLWMQKKQQTHQLKVKWLEAKRKRQVAVATQYYRKMLVSLQKQLHFMHQKLQNKEGFFQARKRLREKERGEMLFQIKRLKKELAKSKSDPSKAKELTAKLQTQKKKEIETYKKETKLNLDFYKTRIKRRDHEVKQIKVKRKSLQQAKIDAQKQKDQKKLEDLAKRLGELAGQQAAITRKADLEKIQLKQARLAYINASRRSL